MAVTIKTLLAALESPDAQVRVQAVAVLVRSRDKRAVPFLERAASEDPSPQVRYYARKGIGFLLRGPGDAAAAAASPSSPSSPAPVPAPAPPPAPPKPGLNVAGLSSDELDRNLASDDQWTRLQTVRALEQGKLVQHVPLLIKRLGTEQNRQVLSALILAVGKLGAPDASDALLPFLKNEDARVRANVIEALDALGDAGCFVHLIPFLRDPDNRCRANAVLALRKYGRVNVFKTVEDMLRSKEVWMQDSATFVLGRMGFGPQVFELLQLALASDYQVVRSQARQVVQKLADRGNDRARSLLERLGAADGRPGDEELFERLERLSTAGSAELAQVAAPVTPARARPGKDPGEALEALRRLTEAGSSGQLEATEGPEQRLERRAEAALSALQNLAATFRTSAAAPPDPTQLSGAFEAVSLDDLEEEKFDPEKTRRKS